MEISEITEEQVREAAYHIWNNEGQPEGQAEEHWFRALNELQSKDEAKVAPKRKAQTA